MESGFWELLTEKKAIAGQNQGHRKSQDCLKLLTRIGEPQQQRPMPGELSACCATAVPHLISFFPHFFPHSSG